MITADEADRPAAALPGDLLTKLGGLPHAQRVAAGVDELSDESAAPAALLSRGTSLERLARTPAL